MRKKLIDKKAKKRIDKKCYFCDIADYAQLNVHRIIPGAEGGKYTEHNCITVCANCHNRIHDGQIKIDRKYFTSGAKWILHYWVEGVEYWQ